VFKLKFHRETGGNEESGTTWDPLRVNQQVQVLAPTNLMTPSLVQLQIAFCFAKTVYWKQYEKKWCRIQLKCNKEWCTMDSLIFFYFSWGTQLFKNMMKKTKAKCFSVWSSGRILGWRLMAGCWERWMPACHLLQNKTTAMINKNWRYAVKLW
jgi:hypothetical protein